MKLLLLLVLLVSVLCVEGYCNYNNNIVTESGYPPRPMTQSEKDQLVVYGKQWDQWGQQFTRYMQGRDTMPTTPVMPCFCHKCILVKLVVDFSLLISMNRSRFSTELDEGLETFFTNFSFTMGSISSILSVFTFHLLVKKSSFFTIDIRILLLFVQISTFLNNFHLCILFVPFIYPFVGGGFCNGVLCMLGVRFHYGMCLWLLTVVLLCSSFVVLMFAKHQSLLQPWSKLKLRFSRRLIFYIYTFASMLNIPILFYFSDTPIEIQKRIVQEIGLDWIADDKVYGIINGCDRQIFVAFLTYSMLGNIIIFGSITAILFILMLHIIITTNINRMSNNSRLAYRAKIKNSLVVLSQMISAFCLGVVPLCVMVATIGIGVSPETEKIVILGEILTTFVSPVNSIIFIFGNKQYSIMIKELLRRSSLFGRSQSISDPDRRMVCKY